MKFPSAVNLTIANLVAGLVLAIASFSAVSASAQTTGLETAAPAPVPSLQGTWLVYITLVNCQTQAPIAPAFPSLLTFDQGGTMTESTASPAFYPAIRNPAHGVWSQVSTHHYQSAMMAYITLNGVPMKTQTIRQYIGLDETGQNFTSKATIEFDSPAGKPLRRGCAAAIATRFE
jgi:hypothetical protein